jgi:hypothetical protein
MIYVAIASGAIGIAAQMNSNVSAQAPPAARITVVGCVEPTEQPAGGTTSKFKLTHAKSRKSDSAPATGASGNASKAQEATIYRLDNAKDATLALNVGDQVEIVAVIEPEKAVPTGTAGSSAAAANEPALQVETIRVISTICPE